MQDLYQLMLAAQNELEIKRVMKSNEVSQQFGLELSEDDAHALMICRQDSLRKHERVELGEGILPKLIFAFCDSQYIEQEEYSEILTELQEIFYMFKNESKDQLTDDELIAFMKDQFERICYGSVEYLADTCLERFSRAIRAGYQTGTQDKKKDEYSFNESDQEYTQFSEETRWERELYWEALGDLFK